MQKPELLRSLSRATDLVEGSIDQMIKELRDQIIESNRAGRAVKVEGLGTYAPTSAWMARSTCNELVAKWNADSPTDMVE